MRWDIFCQIVDNYGDAGVCWRLARSLSQMSVHGDDIRIRLFCDDLDVLDQIAHGNATHHGATLGIEVLPWEDANTTDSIGDVVIEAFACTLPAAYVNAMASSKKQPVWLNLEYLTAEPWADEMHLLPSPQNNGLNKYFYFPGFTHKTGGVALGDWDTVTNITDTPESLRSNWQQCRSNSKKISIFNYRHAPLEAWLRSLDQIAHRQGDIVDVLICANQNISNNFFRQPFKSLRLIQLPFVPQEDYDWLVAHCDFNLVRGEDSFVRAQWAGKPFIWDIYPQEDLAHEIKLEAFLKLYFEGASSELCTAAIPAMKWASPETWWPYLETWQAHSKGWTKKLRALGPLEGKIIDFVKSQEISR